MKASMRSAITRIFILFLLVCAGSFAWESSRNSEMQPATGQVIGTVYKGYIISYELQEHRHAELINTLNGHHGITLSFAALLFLFLVGVLLSVIRGKSKLD